MKKEREMEWGKKENKIVLYTSVIAIIILAGLCFYSLFIAWDFKSQLSECQGEGYDFSFKVLCNYTYYENEFMNHNHFYSTNSERLYDEILKEVENWEYCEVLDIGEKRK